MLEEIEVPPDFVQCVVRLTGQAATFGTGELATPRKIDVISTQQSADGEALGNLCSCFRHNAEN
jgi:hypothetical protein